MNSILARIKQTQQQQQPPAASTFAHPIFGGQPMIADPASPAQAIQRALAGPAGNPRFDPRNMMAH